MHDTTNPAAANSGVATTKINKDESIVAHPPVAANNGPGPHISAGLDFLATLYPDDIPGYLTIFAADKTTRFFTLKDRRDAMEYAAIATKRQNVWFGVGLREAELPNDKRGDSSDIVAIPGFYVEIDYLHTTHKRDDLPPTVEDGRGLLDVLPHPPSLVIHSGHGIQVYYLFHEPFTIEDAEDREYISDLLVRFQKLIKTEARRHDWHVDSTHDLARVLRIPGTINRKGEPVPVRVIERDDNARYAIEDILPLLPEREIEQERRPRPDAALRANDEDFEPADFDMIASECAFIAHCRDDAETLSEPSWYKLVTISARCEDGDRLTHDLSSPYPGYSSAETTRKIKQAMSRTSAYTCKAIRRDGGERYCSGCQHWGKVKSPIVLGRETPTLSFNGVHPPVGGDDDDPEAAPYTDLWNAEQIVQTHGADLRYCSKWNKWLTWDEKRYRVDDTGEAMRRAKQTVKAMYATAAAAPDDEAKKLGRHAYKSMAEARLKAMVELAKSEPGIPVTPDQLDRDTMLLNVENGVIDLRTGHRLDHDRKRLITKLAPVRFDATATCPVFLEYLDTIMNKDKDLIAFLQRVVGYLLTGMTSERVIFILFGTGANGKTTLIEIIRLLLGDYAMRVPTKTLMSKKDEGIPNDIARLQGARFVSASETEEGRRLAESFIKDITGGDTITARFMRGEWFDFTPEFKIALATNHKPEIRGTDKAIWDRIRLIPFEVRIPEQRQDKHLLGKLKAELPGILNWSLAGCTAWQKDGLGTPRRVASATSDYRNEMDTLGDWIADCCTLDPDVKHPATSLYSSFKQWCQDNGERFGSQKAFGMKLKERGFQKHSDGSARSWKGIRLNDDLAQQGFGAFHLTDRHQFDGSEGKNRITEPTQDITRKPGKTGNDPSVGNDPSGEAWEDGEV